MNQQSPANISPETLPLFRNIPAALREHLLADAVTHGVAAGTILFQQGDTPTFQYVVLTGSVQLFGRSGRARRVLVETVLAPDLILPAAVVTGEPYLMEACAPEATRLLLIRTEPFRDAVANNAALANAVIGSLAQQFRRMVRQAKNLKLRSAVERVGCYLLALSSRQKTPDRALLPYEKTLLASELGMTRESFSRTLKSLEKSGIKVRGQVIEIVNRDRLAAKCGPDPLIDGQADLTFADIR